MQEGAGERGTSQEGTGESNAGERGTSQEGTRKPGASELGASQEGTRESNAEERGTSQESTGEPRASEQGASQEGTGEPQAGERGTSQEGTRESRASEQVASQEGTGERGTSQEGIKEPRADEQGTSQEGTVESSASEQGTSQEGVRDLNTSQNGSTRERGTSQEGTRDPSAVQIGDIEPSSTLEEDGKTGILENSSLLQQGEKLGGSSEEPSEPHHETEEYATIPKEDEQETDQEPLPEPKGHTQPLLEEWEEGEVEQSQDSEPWEMVDDERLREELTQEYHALVQDRDKILQQNGQLQHKLYEYFRKKKGEETRPETSKSAADQEQRYLKYLTTLEEMRKKYQEEAALHQQQIEDLSALCQEVVGKVNKEWTAFQEQKKKVALYSLSKRGAGKHAASSLIQEIELLQSREDRKEKDVIQVRLENIKLKNQIRRYECTLRSKEELAEGLHLIDFEQLKIENQTYNEKIEERNEELLKLRKKITNTVQVLTHVKEKLQFVQAENQQQEEKLMGLEGIMGKKRDILTKTKQARDSLRMDNLKLKQKCGLLGNKVLLRDFEDKVDTTEELRQTLENLKRHHAELTLSSKGLMKKIHEAKLVMED
ncbi:cilia- and flagella-associated protein 184 [Eleutherodactylus coqui]|uniref:cilia- and flagella-associated protein 184 n=1 Tax=Eleutherodactylus coqui TaxID=57060 RepID=UPI003461A10D